MKARQDFTHEADYLEYLRHYYAGLAMAAWINKSNVENPQQDCVSIDAVDYADALIKQLYNI